MRDALEVVGRPLGTLGISALRGHSMNPGAPVLVRPKVTSQILSHVSTPFLTLSTVLSE